MHTPLLRIYYETDLPPPALKWVGQSKRVSLAANGEAACLIPALFFLFIFIILFFSILKSVGPSGEMRTTLFDLEQKLAPLPT